MGSIIILIWQLRNWINSCSRSNGFGGRVRIQTLDSLTTFLWHWIQKLYLKEQFIHLLRESTAMCFHSSGLPCTSAWSFHEVCCAERLTQMAFHRQAQLHPRVFAKLALAEQRPLPKSSQDESREGWTSLPATIRGYLFLSSFCYFM